jgi:hypothetical protein
MVLSITPAVLAVMNIMQWAIIDPDTFSRNVVMFSVNHKQSLLAVLRLATGQDSGAPTDVGGVAAGEAGRVTGGGADGGDGEGAEREVMLGTHPLVEFESSTSFTPNAPEPARITHIQPNKESLGFQGSVVLPERVRDSFACNKICAMLLWSPQGGLHHHAFNHLSQRSAGASGGNVRSNGFLEDIVKSAADGGPVPPSNFRTGDTKLGTVVPVSVGSEGAGRSPDQ